MKDDLCSKIILVCIYYTTHCTTCRDTAEKLKISKSAVHKYVSKSIYKIDKDLAESCHERLMKNKELRATHGGNATKLKYLKLRELKNS